MKMLFVVLCTVFSLSSFGKVTIEDKEAGIIKLTGADARKMTKIILEAPVLVTEDEYILTVYTHGVDFNYNRRRFKTGKVSCLQTAKRCFVQGSEIRENGDGWFSPAEGYARVFGLGTLQRLDKKKIFKCDKVYENIACDFKL